MDKELVSIIVPVYNVEKYIDECIESLVNQTYKEVEIILIDDGSKDSSANIMDEWARKDSRISAYHYENGGVSVARNRGIEKAKGKYVFFVDSDDFAEIDAVETMIKEAEVNRLDLAIFNNYKAGEHERVKNEKYSKLRGIFTGKEFFNNAVKEMNSFLLNIPWNKLYRLDIIKENGIEFNKDFKLGEDFIFNLEYFKYCKKVGIFEDVTYNYRLLETGLTLSKKPIDYMWNNAKKTLVYLEDSGKTINKDNIQPVNNYKIYSVKYNLYSIVRNSYYSKKERIDALKWMCKDIKTTKIITYSNADKLRDKIYIFIFRNKLVHLIFFLFSKYKPKK